MQRRNFIRQNVFPLLTAMIWGTAFVAQSIGADYIEPFAFNALRGAIAFVFLLALSLVIRARRKRDFGEQAQPRPGSRRDLVISGICCGTALTLGAALQQAGLATTSPGKAGFITAMYIIIVPLMGLLFHKKMPGTVWAGVGIAIAGLYCLCIQENFSITRGDFYIFLCAIAFAVQILLVDYFIKKVDGVYLSCIQQLVMAVLSAAASMAFESFQWESILSCVWPLLYMGICSGGIAYTLQILAQKDANPTVVSLLLSLEALFGTVAGALILHDRLSGREYLGCGLMLAAIVLAQIPPRKKPSGGGDGSQTAEQLPAASEQPLGSEEA